MVPTEIKGIDAFVALLLVAAAVSVATDDVFVAVGKAEALAAATGVAAADAIGVNWSDNDAKLKVPNARPDVLVDEEAAVVVDAVVGVVTGATTVVEVAAIELTVDVDVEGASCPRVDVPLPPATP